MKQSAFFVIDVGDKFAPFANCSETINCLRVIVTVGIGEFDKAESKKIST